MAQIIDNISTIASNYDVIVLDQYGVLHDGKAPYASAIECLNNLTKNGTRLAVLSNSGKYCAHGKHGFCTIFVRVCDDQWGSNVARYFKQYNC